MKKKGILLISCLLIILIFGFIPIFVKGEEESSTTSDSDCIVIGTSAHEILRKEWTYDMHFYTWGYYGSSSAIADLGPDVNNFGTDPDSDLEIVTGSDETWGPPGSNGVWRTFDSIGNLEWQRGTETDEARSSPVIIDIDGDCDLEIAGGTTSGWYFQVMDHQGNFVWTFPKLSGILIGGNFEWCSSPAAADLDSSVSGVELVIGNRPRGNVWCFDGDNTDGINDGYTVNPFDFLGWPYPLGTEGTDWDVLWIFNTGAQIYASPAIGDVDNDGKLEVVMGSTNGNVYVLNGSTGALEHMFTTGDAIYASAALADLDGDGYLEIIIGSTDNTVYCFQWDGAVGSTEWMYATGGAVYSSAAIGDINNDGGYEIVVGSNDGNVYAFNILGVLEWSYSTGGAVYSSPALAERCNIDPYDKDWPMFRHNPARTGLYGGAPPTSLDIYIGSDDGFLHLIEGDDGTEIDRFRVNVGWYPDPQGGIHTSPVVADVDGDENLEIFFYDWGQGSIYNGHTYWALEDAIIRKEMSSSSGGLGSIVHITLHVGVPSGVTVKVLDTLPNQFTFIPGTFEVNDISASPTVIGQEISYTITDPCYHKIEFDIKITEAKWEEWMVYNLAKVEWYKGCDMYHEKEITKPFVIEPFEELQKSVIGYFTLTQDGQTWVIDPIERDKSAAEFYDYYSVSAHTGLEEPYHSFIYLYRDTTTPDEVSLFIVHDIDGNVYYPGEGYNSGSPDAQCWMDLSGIPSIAYLAQSDDPGELSYTTGTSTAEGRWHWWYNTDGGAIGGLPTSYSWCITIDPILWVDVDIWAYYCEGDDNIDLDMNQPITICYTPPQSLAFLTNTEVQFAIEVEVTNPFGYTMEDTKITDRFGAEIELDLPIPFYITHGTVDHYTKGKSAKVFLTWDIGDLLPGETARLILLVSTDLNPAGHQEYTTSDVYELNSGATLKFIDPEQDMQLSAVTDSIYVEACDIIIF
ncbi:MAG: FG-GAP-like repeat-containing protein [Candidatus Heimdallarchaeota archaeon]